MVTASSSSSSGRDDTLFPFLLLHPRPFYFSLPLGRMLVCFCLWTRHHVHLPTHPSPSCSILPLELRLVRVALPRLGRREAFFICPEQFSSRSMSWIQNTNLVGYFFFLTCKIITADILAKSGPFSQWPNRVLISMSGKKNSSFHRRRCETEWERDIWYVGEVYVRK